MGDMGDLGGEDFGAEDLGGEELGAEDLGGEELGAEEGAEEGGDLLATPGEEAAPAKRDSLRHYEKSSYKAKGQEGKKRGGLTRALQGTWAKETASNTTRNLHKGKQDLDSLIRLSHSLSEDQESNYYDKQEKQLFKENFEIKKLIESLEKSHEV